MCHKSYLHTNLNSREMPILHFASFSSRMEVANTRHDRCFGNVYVFACFPSRHLLKEICLHRSEGKGIGMVKVRDGAG